jgi:hypothetical protein
MEYIIGMPEQRHWDEEKLEEWEDEDLAKCIDDAIRSEETEISFAAIWGNHDGLGNKGAPNPLDIDLAIDNPFILDPVYYRVSLRDAIIRDLDHCAEDGSFSLGLSRISVGLKKLASEIDAVIEVARAKGKRGMRLKDEEVSK